jgi:2-iminoacetate synthase
MTESEVEKAAAAIAATGINHVLLLTGDSRENSPVEYIIRCVRIIKRYFSSISVEIYALTQEEYARLIQAGVDGLTIYQETYDERLYDTVHVLGPKKDFLFRLEAAERAGQEMIRAINIGALLGLGDWQHDVFLLGLHARYLQERFPAADISVSLPRLRPHAGSSFPVACPVSDAELVQCITALRIFLPFAGITISTRENKYLREYLLPLGVTRMSAGSSTKVGGRLYEGHEDPGLSQFEIADQRNVSEIKEMVSSKGYQPVMKDWMNF